ncbi:MAG TPA: mannitol dehydrogenase family protein [Allosphingosinicella sp.]|jgi:fructuronate reductase
MRLSAATVPALAAEVARPGYDRTEQAAGIVHFGIGAFHRAHQAVYTDAAMAAGDRHWGIVGVSLRSAGVRDQLASQDGLYTVTERSGAGKATRLMGAVQRVLVGAEESDEIIAAIVSPTVRIVSFTVTEKGYHRAADGGLDASARPIAADLVDEGPPATIYGFLRRGLAARREAGLPGLTLLSCDNLAQNGAVLAALLADYLTRVDRGLARWFEQECACPSTMVDRIVPATSAEDLDRIEALIGVRDEGAVVTEPFSQWVIEDRFAGPRPSWERAGATFVPDVRLHEMAKLRMLNGAHSALAYLGLDRGHGHVHEAVRDPEIRPLIERLMRDEAASSLPPGIDTAAYADRLLERFDNPELPHRLSQIAMDGSQKIPQRWLATLAHHGARGRQCPALLEALAAWLRHVRGDRRPVGDPRAGRLRDAWGQAGAEGIAPALFGRGAVFPMWQPTEADLRFIEHRLQRGG